MNWRIFRFPEGEAISPADLVSGFGPVCELPVSILCRNGVPSSCNDDEAVELLTAVHRHNYPSIFLCDGRIESWLFGLLAAADLAISTPASVFDSSEMEERTAALTATLLGRLLGKSRAIQVLVEQQMSAERMLQLGLVARIVPAPQMENPKELLNEMFSDVSMDAIKRLKRAWAIGNGKEFRSALARERMEFQRCFIDGAAEDIAEYLSNRRRK